MKFPMGCSIAESTTLGFFVPQTSINVAMADPTIRKDIDAAAAAAAKQKNLQAAASLIAGQSAAAPYASYGGASSGLPSWLIPVGLGVGALALFMALRK